MKPREKSRPKTNAPAIDLAAAGGESRINPRLPHERDELAQNEGATPRGQIKRAYRDLAQGQVDTDCRNSAAGIIKKKSMPRLGSRRKRDVR